MPARDRRLLDASGALTFAVVADLLFTAITDHGPPYPWWSWPAYGVVFVCGLASGYPLSRWMARFDR